MDLVCSLLLFSLFEGNPSGVPVFVFISNLFCSLSNLSFSGLFPGANSKAITQ